MTTISFGDDYQGTQVGINYGSINYQYAQKENKERDTDRGFLRSLSFPEMLDRRDNIAPCHTDTCRWILDLDDFKNWKIQSRGLLWIKGKPGAGKSTLMAFLYGQLSEGRELKRRPDRDGSIRLDFFFSARGTELQHTPLGMLRSLLNQLYDFDETVRPPFRRIFEDRCRQYGYGKNHWQWTQVKLEELLADAILDSAKRQQVMVFVDALDEAGAEFAQHVASYFHRLTSLADKTEAALKICISCRHYPIVGNAQAVSIVVEAHNRDDIASYIENAFVGIAAPENQEDLKNLTKHLIRQADGVFQWIHLLVPSIKRRIAERESFDEIYSWLREVPAGLEEVYVYIINHVIVEHNRKQSLLLFQWVCLSERPLNVTEMRYALATGDVQISLSQTSGSEISICPQSLESCRHFIDNDDRAETRITALSGGLAELIPTRRNNKPEKLIQVVHQSVNDFLCNKGFELLSNLITGNTSPLDDGKIILGCQATLYRSCLICVAAYAQAFEEINDSIRDPGDIAQQIAPQCNELSHYATVHLFNHAKKAARFRLGIFENEVDLLLSIMAAWISLRNHYSLQLLDLRSLRIQGGTVLLHIAASYNLVDIIESLSDRSEDIEKRDYSGNTALYLAAQEGHTAASKILCDRGASCEAKNDTGQTALSGVASQGNLELFEWLLYKGALAGVNDNKDNALRVAAEKGFTKMVRILIDTHADVNAQGGSYGNALQAATYGGHVEVIRILINAHADVNAQGGQFGNALQAAAWRGHSEVIRMLLNSQADVNAQGGSYGNALQAAAYGGHVEVFRILINAHADVNARGGQFGDTLQAAARCGRSDVVQILIDAHVDVNVQGGSYGSALQAAARGGYSRVIRMLLDAHADVNAQGGAYGNALQAAIHGRYLEVIQMLLDAHVDINIQGGRYGNSLQAAASEARIDIVRILLDNDADVNAQGGIFGNALQAAVYRGSLQKARLLLDTHANVNAQGGIYGNALQAAACMGHCEIARILLDAHVDVNAQGGKYGNALQAATVKGRTDIVRILLDADADVNAQGGKYGNSLQAAIVHGRTDIFRILLDSDADVNPQGGKYGNALEAAIVERQIGIMRILLRDARSDVSVQGGKWQSAILTVLSAGSSDDYQFHPNAGVYPPLLDGLGQNPLHIAASRSSALSMPIDTAFQSPFLAFGLETRDKLLRTPLHAAIYRGVAPSSAINLLRLGADPSILDGYGRNIVDWTQGNRYWMDRISPHCSLTLLTPHETQYLTICQSVIFSAETVLHSLPNLQWPIVQQLGHFLLSLNDEDRAIYLFRLHLYPGSGVFRIECFKCESWIYGEIFVCRKCPNVVLCSSCASPPIEGRLHTREHKLLKILSLHDKEQPSRSKSKELSLILREIIDDYSAKITFDPKKGFSSGTLLSTAQEKNTLLSSKTTFCPAIIACSFLFVIFAILARCLYF
ncbi:unnamed protein product [Penicillium salamii]|nr:unnamed protein product [Penicillium salamii]CAG8274966.1 unnamed protein product [Penicillium salamii]CAG8364053.1 unnamed protein product [Penicillium salamii]